MRSPGPPRTDAGTTDPTSDGRRPPAGQGVSRAALDRAVVAAVQSQPGIAHAYTVDDIQEGMRHYTDLYAVFPKRQRRPDSSRKQIAWNDLYQAGKEKLGTFQSFGALPPTASLIADIEKDLALVMRPRSRSDRWVLTEVLVEAGLTLINEAENSRKMSKLAQARQVRNGLMVAMLAMHPVRLKNFAALEIGAGIGTGCRQELALSADPIEW